MSDDEDYEHWGDEDKQSDASTSRSAGYDRYNGLRKWDYLPTDTEQKETKAKSEASKPASKAPSAASVRSPPPPAAPPSAAGPQAYYMAPGYPQMQYGMPPAMQMAYPAPAYYGYPAGVPGYGYMPGPGGGWVCQPAAAAEEKRVEPKKKEKPAIMKWQGRTKAEVEEDNMKIAKRAGACAPRKVEPKGLAEDQMIWCVELDNSSSLRTYATIKGFKGEWRADPRYKDSWFFVRQEETSD